MNWDKPLQFFKKYGFSSRFIADMYDGFLSLLEKKPTFDIFKFDDYIHYEYGDYEDKGKTLKDMFVEIFGKDALTAQAYFGIYEYKKMPEDFIRSFLGQ